MNNESKINSFGRKAKKRTKKVATNKAVIYTRVSSQRQVNNSSLKVQRTNCEQFAKVTELNVVRIFGGTHESAKTDSRLEFDKMLKYVKEPKNEISVLIVSELDRFSRSGINAIALKDELYEYGVCLCESFDSSVNTSREGSFGKDVRLLVAKNENETRARKCRDGVISRLKDGYWIGVLTKGYKKVDKTTLEFTPEAEYIKEAFLLKRDGYTTQAIIERVNSKGGTLTKSRLSAYFRNPFYCGYITSSHLDGEVIKGKHKALVSEDLFLEINNLMAKNPQGYKSEKHNENRPLQADLKCSCSGLYTGYCKKEKYHYYKCNACKNNCSVGVMHSLFEEYLGQYSFTSDYTSLFSKQLKYTFTHLNADKAAEQKKLKTALSKLESKKEKCEENLAFGGLDKTIFKRVVKKLDKQIKTLEREIKSHDFDLSNSNDFVAKSLGVLSDLGGLWSSSDLEIRREIQNLVFDSNIRYDKDSNSYRTPKVNSLFSIMAEGLEQKKAGQKGFEANLSRFVPEVGIEPTLLAEHEFESCASTSSAIRANGDDKSNVV